MDDILNLAQAHEFLGVSEKTLRNYCKAGKLPFHHERNQRGVMEYRFRKADLEAFAQQRTRAAGTPYTPAPKAVTPANDGKQPLTLASDYHGSVIPPSRGSAPGHTRCASAPATAISPVADGQREDCEGWARELVSQLQAEVAFLKEQLQERDRQIAAKDRQLERQLERIGNLNETLANLALGRVPPHDR